MRRFAVPGLFAGMAALSAGHAIGPLGDAAGAPSTRTWLIAVYFAMRACIAIAFAYFTFTRPAPLVRAREPIALVSCAVAMVLVLPFGGPGKDTATAQVLAGDVLAIASCAWLLASVLVLGRCFGVLPEARGLVTRGPYRIVRHPVYLGEIGALVALTLASGHGWMLTVLALFVAAQLVRMRLEERALTAAFPEYAAYAQRTARLLPGFRPARELAGTSRPAPWSSST